MRLTESGTVSVLMNMRVLMSAVVSDGDVGNRCVLIDGGGVGEDNGDGAGVGNRWCW